MIPNPLTGLQCEPLRISPPYKPHANCNTKGAPRLVRACQGAPFLLTPNSGWLSSRIVPGVSGKHNRKKAHPRTSREASRVRRADPTHPIGLQKCKRWRQNRLTVDWQEMGKFCE